MGNGPKRGHFSRSRSLQDFNQKFSPNILEKAIATALKQNKTVRVLEIGCGEGRVLMELIKLFPQIELHGINKKPWEAMQSSSSLIKTGLHYNIFNKSEIKGVILPKIYFYDAKKLNFPKDYFDLIYSQVAIPYVDRKDQLLEEVWRVLKKNGKAFLNIDGRKKPCPDFLNYETPTFIIYKKGKIYPFKNLVSQLKKKSYDLKLIESQEIDGGIKKVRINLIMNKNLAKPLKLNLHFEKLSSFDLGSLNQEKNDWSVYWGYRSVFTI